ncbi:MAG TPA: SdrD B-like domain-containing protein [Anaerolineales bacterium]|nr:SdrD B-like domain-containing protein [Anaerolineales bacterium]
MPRPLRRIICIAFLISLLLNGCNPSPPPATARPEVTPRNTPTPTIQTPTATFTPTPQPTSRPASYGPDQTDFPADVNPLTGQTVSDPSLLKIPAMLVSISHFPPTARPQAGLSFAPYVFEFSITEGESRFLTVFYGAFPYPEVPLSGGCGVRQGAFVRSAAILGRRIWLDANGNGIQDPGEGGVGGVCVDLYDAQGNLIQRTTSDSNGYYGFNVQNGGDYTVEFVRPQGMQFTPPNVGDDTLDSDADPASGRTELIHVKGDDLSWDAGLTVSAGGLPTPTGTPTAVPAAAIGPIRSGRLLYSYIAGFFTDSCLIYAFASPEVLAKIPKCYFVNHEVDGGGFMLDIQDFRKIALDSQKRSDSNFNYSSNLYTDQPPAGGVPASQLNVFYADLNQSGWTYDPLYQAWLRSVDTADPKSAGVLHLEVDRLNGRQLHFENVIVLMADTDVVSPTNLDIHLEEGATGYAFLFRDGLMYRIRWSTLAGDYEQRTGFERPIRFINADGSPAALKPGHTWVVIVTPFSYFAEQQSGAYLVRYIPPQGEAR